MARVFTKWAQSMGRIDVKKQDTSDMEPVNRAARRAIASNRKNAGVKTDITKWQRRK